MNYLEKSSISYFDLWERNPRLYKEVSDPALQGFLEEFELFRVKNLPNKPITIQDCVTFVGEWSQLDVRLYGRIADFIVKHQAITPYNPAEVRGRYPLGKEGVRAMAALHHTFLGRNISSDKDIPWAGFQGERGLIGETIVKLGNDKLVDSLTDPYPLRDEEREMVELKEHEVIFLPTRHIDVQSSSPNSILLYFPSNDNSAG